MERRAVLLWSAAAWVIAAGVLVLIWPQPRSFAPLIDDLGSPDDRIAGEATSDLAAAGAAAVPALTAALRDPRVEVRRRAAMVLGQARPVLPATVDLLVAQLRDHDEGVREGALVGLGAAAPDARGALGELERIAV